MEDPHLVDPSAGTDADEPAGHAADEPTGAERRLVNRYVTPHGVVVSWRPAKRRRLLDRGKPVPTALVLDLSVTGMLLEAPAEPEVGVGEIVTLGGRDGNAVARVAHAQPGSRPDLVVFGVEIVSMPTAFRDDLHRAIGELRRQGGGALPPDLPRS